MTSPDDPSLARYARLEAFLQRLSGDVYPEPASQLHTDLTTRMFETVQRMHPLSPAAKVLDVGCGQGVALEIFREAGLDGLGISVGEDVAACRAKGLNAIEMDFNFLELPDVTFDLIWCRHALEHSVMPYFLLSELFRLLKPGGALYAEVPAPDTSSRHQMNPNHYSVLGKTMWLELIRRSGFCEVKTAELALTTAAGPDLYWAFIAKKAN